MFLKLLWMYQFLFFCYCSKLPECTEKSSERPFLHLCSLVPSYLRTGPRNEYDNPVDIQTLISILSINNFNPNDETFTIELIVKMTWNDTRLTLVNNFNQ